MKITVQFKNDNGDVTVAVFDRDTGKVSAQDGRVGTYTRAEGSKVLEIKGDQDLTLTFADDIKFEPGTTNRYTTATGAGTATIISVA